MGVHTRPAPLELPIRQPRLEPTPTISPTAGSYNGSPGSENAPSRLIGHAWVARLGHSWVTKLVLETDQPRGDYDEIIWLQDHIILGLPILKNVNHVQLKRPFALAGRQVLIDGDIDRSLIAHLAPHINPAQKLVRQVQGDNHGGTIIVFLFQF